MKRSKWIVGGICLCLAAACLFSSATAFAAEAPYEGYTYNYYGRSVPAPIVYAPGDTLYFSDLDTDLVKDAEDMVVYKDELYVLDGGNGRILVFNGRLELVRIMDTFYNRKGTVTRLSAPRGLFIKDDLIYVADTGNERVIAFDMECNQKRLLRRPTSALIDQNLDFRPSKMAVDRGNNVYVLCEGYYQGLVAYNKDDEFTGFYGGNQVEMSFSLYLTQFWKSIFSKEQRESLQRAIPVEYSNLFLVGDFIYTCTKKTQTSKNEVQKLNPKGINILKPTASVGYDPTNFGDIETYTYRSKTYDNIFVDIHVDEDDVISILDQERGRVFMYDQECNLLGIYGVSGTQRGALQEPTAIAKLGSDYLILDKGKNCISTYQETEYMHYIREGIKYYAQGRYEESIPPWEKVLQFDSRCSLAYRSLGKAALQRGEYEKALAYFKQAQDRTGYSRALREYRKELSGKYFFLIVAGIILVIVLLKLLIGWVLRRLGVKKVKTRIVFE